MKYLTFIQDVFNWLNILELILRKNVDILLRSIYQFLKTTKRNILSVIRMILICNQSNIFNLYESVSKIITINSIQIYNI